MIECERMSCSVKISCSKGWSGSQRRINSLAEETTATCPSNASSSNCCTGLQVSQPTATSSTTATSTVTVALNNPVTTTTVTATTVSAAVTVASSVAASGGNQRVVPPRPVRATVARKGEDTTKLLKYIDDNVIGKNGTFFGPFGRRKGQ